MFLTIMDELILFNFMIFQYSNIYCNSTVYRHIDEATEAGLSSFDAFVTNAGGGIPYTLGFPITADDDGLVRSALFSSASASLPILFPYRAASCNAKNLE